MEALIHQVESLGDEKVNALINNSIKQLELDGNFKDQEQQVKEAILKINQNGNKMEHVMELVYTMQLAHQIN